MRISEFNIPQLKINQLENKGIYTVEDLLRFYPRKYLDFRQESAVTFDNVGKEIAVIGTLTYCTMIGPRKNVIKCIVETSNGEKLDVLWFNQDYLYDKYSYWVNSKVAVCGKLNRDISKFRSFTMCNPTFFTQSIQDVMKIFPIYPKVPGMAEEYLKNLISKGLKQPVPPDYLPENARAAFRVCAQEDLFQKIHHPKDENDINDGKRRLIFDDMFYFASRLLRESKSNETSPYVVKEDALVRNVVSNLPFVLTEDQRTALREIFEECRSGRRLNGLVQGDVGSGKTIVAFLSMVLFAENGYQSVLMAPTQVLANQHFQDLKDLVAPYGLDVVLLQSKMKAKERREAYRKIADGSAKLIVGTHSVFSQEVVYNNLALVITDEEHKFGVAQRDAIVEKADQGVHSISMSATPIPRTLASTLYGTTKSVFTISQMPAGRKQVKTDIERDENKVFEFMRTRILKGEQCYVVCPLITKSDSERLEDVEAVEDVFDRIQKYFRLEGIESAIVTGSTKAAETEQILSDFKNNKIQILVSTTIIEVGVNVPNATTIVIKNAERFGLAQLHQLRGRVGRGAKQGYCILQPKNEEEELENQRLQIMCQTNNGFEIAEADLKYRGCGDLIGTKQSGDNKYVELMLLYPKFYAKVKEYAKAALAKSE